MTAIAVSAWFPTDASNKGWAHLSTQAPHLTATMRRYLVQLTTFLAPRSVEAADQTLRQFARWLTTATDLTVVAGIERSHIEDYKVWLADQPGRNGSRLAKNTQRQRLRMIRIFLERLIEWDWPDAPGRNPILHGDIPPRSEPIPKFLTDQQAAAFIAAAKQHPLPRYRLVAQVLARTGLRATELCELAADAVARIGTDGYWLRIPVGKLRNDRMIPSTPNWSSCSPTGPPPTTTTSGPPVGSLPTTTHPSTGEPCTASSPASEPLPASTTCTPTGSVTPSPPKPSTAA